MPDDPGISVTGSILLILFFTLVNAFLAGAEMAFVSLNPARIRSLAEKGDRRARKVEKLLASPDSFLSAIQVGITFAGFFNSAQASQAFLSRLLPALGNIPAAATVANLILTLIISYVSLVLGELYPKQLALQVPEGYAMRSAGTILFLRGAFRPFIWLLTTSVGILKRLTPVDFTKREEKLTRQEMKALLNSSRNDGAIGAEEFNMMRGVLSLDTRLVREIMVPRVNTDMLDAAEPFEKNMEQLLAGLRSRIPLYEEDKDHILGIIHMKDVLLNLQALQNHEMDLRDIARPALFVPDTMYTDELLVQFQKSKQHLAVLVDEFGGVSGIVTLEDLIEEIVGEIRDEYDVNEEEVWQKVSDDEYIFDAGIDLDDLNRLLGIDLPTGESDTLGGYIFSKLGKVPTEGEEIKTDGLHIEVLSVDDRRIRKIRLERIPEASVVEDAREEPAASPD